MQATVAKATAGRRYSQFDNRRTEIGCPGGLTREIHTLRVIHLSDVQTPTGRHDVGPRLVKNVYWWPILVSLASEVLYSDSLWAVCS
jgi:hypothetical protein